MRTLDPSRTREFKDVLGRFCTGVAVVASVDQDGPVGFTCQAFSALSLDPPLILLCPSRTSTSWPRIRRARRLAISVLEAGQEDISNGFACSAADKFSGVRWTPSPAGMPVLDGALAWLDCDIHREYEGGDHTIAVCGVTALGEGSAADPLLFFRGSYTEIQRTEIQRSEAMV